MAQSVFAPSYFCCTYYSGKHILSTGALAIVYAPVYYKTKSIITWQLFMENIPNS